jgi:AbrB family looped-hinge helix DNA binding protein
VALPIDSSRGNRLSSKGQVIIPHSVRDAHGWEAGTEFTVEDIGDAIVLRARKVFPATRLEDGLGCTGYKGPPKSIAEMHEGIVEEMRRRWRDRT